uniref:Sugar phosphate transporter domain-containing protein n=1 Tax=Piliocolobus tephrosceles TaxID=591936 RepID=A0A8C9H7U7_9PRIM
MNLFIKSLIIAVVINIQIKIGRCLNNQDYYYGNYNNVNIKNYMLKSNVNDNIKKKNIIYKHNSKQKSYRNDVSFFLKNYKPKYNIINNLNKNNYNNQIIYSEKIKINNGLLNSMVNQKNGAHFFHLFNNSIKKNITNLENAFEADKIIDDISSAEHNDSNLKSKSNKYGYDNQSDNKKKENNLTKSLSLTNSSNKNVEQKKENKTCNILNKAVEGGKTISLLGLWYVCNIFYNIENKKALNMLNLPITIALAQIYVGIPIFLVPWLLKLRKQPELFYDEEELKKIKLSDSNNLIKYLQKYKLFLKKYNSIIKQSIYHGYAHLLSVIAMGAGAISFVHIVKASSPLFAALFAFFLTNDRMSIYTYSSLIPIVFGVSLASIKELSFTYKALYSTLAANVLSTMRGIEAKTMMNKNLDKIGKNLSAENIFALLTLFSAILLTPALYLDAHKWKNAYIYLKNNQDVLKVLSKHIVMSGVWFYLYNQLSFISLNRLNHITHAVASTIKRVFLILTSYFIFKTKFSLLGGVGSSMAVAGTFLYSIVKKKY